MNYWISTDGVIDAATVSVFNAARLKTPDGDESTINGVATIPDPTDPGKLLVKFPDIPDDGKCKWNKNVDLTLSCHSGL